MTPAPGIPTIPLSRRSEMDEELRRSIRSGGPSPETQSRYSQVGDFPPLSPRSSPFPVLIPSSRASISPSPRHRCLCPPTWNPSRSFSPQPVLGRPKSPISLCRATTTKADLLVSQRIRLQLAHRNHERKTRKKAERDRPVPKIYREFREFRQWLKHQKEGDRGYDDARWLKWKQELQQLQKKQKAPPSSPRPEHPLPRSQQEPRTRSALFSHLQALRWRLDDSTRELASLRSHYNIGALLSTGPGQGAASSDGPADVSGEDGADEKNDEVSGDDDSDGDSGDEGFDDGEHDNDSDESMDA